MRKEEEQPTKSLVVVLLEFLFVVLPYITMIGGCLVNSPILVALATFMLVDSMGKRTTVINITKEELDGFKRK
jgi:hypothetical protein